jgi:hypothetical protein
MANDPALPKGVQFTQLPEQVYKFRHFNSHKDTDPRWQGYAASVLRDNLVYFAATSDLNDPWECRPAFAPPNRDMAAVAAEAFIDAYMATLYVGHTAEQRAEVVAQVRQGGYEAAVRKMEEALAKMNSTFFFFYSLSGNCTEPRMWSYYARGHTGFCWVFDSRRFPFDVAMGVQYSDEYPHIDWQHWNEQDLFELSFFRKAAFWRHEDEYRIVGPDEEVPLLWPVRPWNGVGTVRPRGRYVELDPTSLVGVIFGASADAVQMVALIDLAATHGRKLKFWQAKTHPRRYEVEIGLLDDRAIAAIRQGISVL